MDGTARKTSPRRRGAAKEVDKGERFTSTAEVFLKMLGKTGISRSLDVGALRAELGLGADQEPDEEVDQ